MWDSTEELHIRQRSSASLFSGRVMQRSDSVRWGLEATLSALVLALLSPFAALRAKSVEKVLLGIVVLDVPLQLGTHLLYREADASSGALAGLSISVTTIALLALYASWFLRGLERRGQSARSSPQRNWALLCYLGFSALSLFVARDARLSGFELFLLLQMYLVFRYVAHFVRTRRDVLFVVSCILAGCLIESILILGLGFADVSTRLWGPLHIRVDHNAGGQFARVGGTVGSPNDAGAYLSVVLSVAVSVLFVEVERKYKWLAAAVLAFGGAALVFTFSRGAWTAFVLATILFFFSIRLRKRISFKPLIPVAAVVLLLYLPFHNEINDRLISDDNGSAESRVPLMNLAFRMIADNPILGVGANNFSAAMVDYLTPELRKGFLYTVHNKYLLVWSEIGPGGLLAYLAFFIGILRIGRACWKQGDPFLSTLALGMTVAVLGDMVHQSVEILQDRGITQLLWLIAALVVAMQGILRERTPLFDLFPRLPEGLIR
jgi:putative inorganic carbon (hco3(-)) transporter